MISNEAISGYKYVSAASGHAHEYLLPHIESILSKHFADTNVDEKRVFDVGCGNGAVAAYLTSLGYVMTGVDPSSDGVEYANEAYPDLKLGLGSAYDPLVEEYGQFPAVISLEVVEHVYAPVITRVPFMN